MRLFFSTFISCFAVQIASASESVTLYAQGCLPYTENGTAYFNCAPEEKVKIELVNTASGVETGSWGKTIILGSSSFIVSLRVEKLTFPSGNVIKTINGRIGRRDNVGFVTATNNLAANTSVSLASLVPFGEKDGLPHFFFGTPLRFNETINERVMKMSLTSGR